MNMRKRLRTWWLRGLHYWDALLAASERGLGYALVSLRATIRRGPVRNPLRFLPALEHLEARCTPAAPVISGVSPATGPVTGGTGVTLTGTGFTGTTAVNFGTGHPAAFTVISDTTLKVTAPAEHVGIVDITVVNSSGPSTPTTADQFTYTDLPSITRISPAEGTTDGGNTVTIRGMNLGKAVAVSFGGTPASFQVSNGQITAKVPAHAAGVVDVQVTTAVGQTAVSSADRYTYVLPIPAVTSISPSSGSTDGGDRVTITGTALTGATRVSFGGTPALSFHVDSDTKITATAPPGKAGTVDIAVTTPSGTSALSSADQFSFVVPVPVVSSISPARGSTDGGQAITITGTDLNGATAVLFGTIQASFTLVSATQIRATTPAEAAGTVDVQVTTPGGQSAAGANDQYTYAVPPPAITSLSPASGTTAGGELITITGADLQGATAVTFGGAPAVAFVQVSPTQIVARAPAEAAGTVDVRVTTAAGRSAVVSADQFQFIAPIPSISSVTPGSGLTSGGQQVAFWGSNLGSVTQVFFGSKPATSFQIVSATEITAVAPPEGAGTVDITVTSPGGQSAASPQDHFTYTIPAPTITIISPATGSTSGGTVVTISGTNLTGATQVLFGSTAAPSFTVVSDTSITATAPPHAAGSFDISVTTPSGNSAASDADKFTYVVPAPAITALSTHQGLTTGGSTVVLTGTNFTGAVKVLFGDVAASFSIDSATRITARAPAQAAGTVTVSVTTSGGTSTASAASQYTYAEPVPIVSGLTPPAGSSSGGQDVTLSGAYFTGATQVWFGATAALSFTVDSDNQITATAPAGAVGSVDVTVTTPSGTSGTAPSDQFHYILVLPTVTSVSPSSGPTEGGTSVTITGVNLAGASAVLFGDTPASSYTIDSPTQITAVAPAGALGVDHVTVTTPGGTSTETYLDAFSYVADGTPTQPTPPASTLAPGSGAAAALANVPTGSSSPSGSPVLLPDANSPGDSSDPPAGPNTTIVAVYTDPPTSTSTSDANGGSYSYSDSWSFTFTITVTDPSTGQTTSSYTYSAGGTYSQSSSWTNDSNGATTGTEHFHMTYWSNTSYWQNDTTTVGTGIPGIAWASGTMTDKSSGTNHTWRSYSTNASWDPNNYQATGSTSNTSHGFGSWSNTGHGSWGVVVPGGNNSGSWHNGGTGNYHFHGGGGATLTAGGIWIPTGSMYNYGGGSSYSSMAGHGLYTLTNSIPGGSSSSTSVSKWTLESHSSNHYRDGSTRGGAVLITVGRNLQGSGDTAWHQVSGSQYSHGSASNSSHATTTGNSHHAISGGQANSTWTRHTHGSGSSSNTCSSNLGSDGIWLSSGSISKGGGSGGDSFSINKVAYNINQGSKNTSWDTGTVHGTGTANTHWSVKYHNGTRLGTAGWAQTTGTKSSGNAGSSSSHFGEGGGYGYALNGGSVKGTWGGGGHAHASSTDHVSSVLTNGAWVTNGTLTQNGSGGGHGSDSGKGSYKLTSGSIGVGSWDTGTVTLIQGDSSHSNYKWNTVYKLGTAGWATVSGSTSNGGGSSSSSTSTASGTYGYTTQGGKVTGTWSDTDTVTSSSTGKAGDTFGGGIWVPSGSVTVTTTDSGHGNYGGNGGYNVSSTSSAGGLGSSHGHESVTETGNDHWKDTITETENVVGGVWQLTAGNSNQSSGDGSKFGYKGNGTWNDAFAGGALGGTWKNHGGDYRKDSNKQIGNVVNGGWVSSGSKSESDGTSAGASYKGNGSEAPPTSGLSSGETVSGSITLKDSGHNLSINNHHSGETQATTGAWHTTAAGSTVTNSQSSSSGSTGNGGYGSKTAGGSVNGTWSSHDTNTYNTKSSTKNTLGSDGVWLSSGSSSVKNTFNADDTSNGKGTLDATSSGVTGGGTDTSGSSSGSSSSSSARNTLANGNWNQVSGLKSEGTHGFENESFQESGGFANGVSGAWNASGGANEHYKNQEKSVLGAGGVWKTTGTEQYGGGSHSKSSENASEKDPLTSSATGWEKGSITVKDSGSSHSRDKYGGELTLTKSGAWHSASGSSSASSGSSSTSGESGGGSSGSTTADNISKDTWSINDSSGSHFNATDKTTLGSDGVWVPSGSMTIGGSSSDHFNNSDKDSLKLNDDSGSSWTTGTASLTSGSSTSGTSKFNESFILDKDGNWDPTSGSASSKVKDSANVSIDGKGDDGQKVNGGSITGTWSIDDSDKASASAGETMTLQPDGTWSTTSWSSSSDNPVDPYTQTFSGIVAGADGTPRTVSGTWTQASSYVSTTTDGATPVVAGFTETVTGSFTENGTTASFTIDIGGTPGAPTTTITQTNTSALNGLSVNAANLGSLGAEVSNAITSTVILDSGTDGSSSTASPAKGTTRTDVYNADGEMLSDTVASNTTGNVLYSATYTYDPAGNRLTSTDGAGRVTAWTYNAQGQVTSETIAFGTPQAATTTYGYDSDGNLISVTDPDGNTTTYTYNEQGQETSMTDPLGNTETMEYNDQGQLIERTNRDGLSETYAYNDADQLVEETWYAADGVTITDELVFTYNTAGQLTSAGNDEGAYTFTYDTQGRVIGVTEPFDVSLTFGYDDNGNRTLVQDSFGGTTQSTYDAANQLVSELFTQQGMPTLRIDQTYNADGEVASQTRFSDAAGQNVVATTNYVYDFDGNTTSIIHTRVTGQILGEYSYVYDAAGDLVSETDNGANTTYQYDATGQLVGYGGTTQTYDPNGNRNAPGYIVGPDNQVLSDGTYTYTYDADGNETSKTNIMTGVTWTYGFNNANEMVSAVETAADGTVETAAIYQYDVFGNRIEKQVWTPATGWTMTRFAYDAWNPNTPSGVGNENWNVWAQLDENNQLVMRNFLGDALDQVFTQISATGTVAWYLTDHLGSTRVLVDSNGNVLDAINYDAFGNITQETNPASQPLFMYTGQVWDRETELQYDRARYYEPANRRWISQDPMKFDAGDSNLYRYVGNNPTNATDPSGLQGNKSIGGADITEVLTNGLNKLEAKYKTLTRKEKEDLANSLYKLPRAAYAWDIVTLIGSNPAEWGITINKETSNTATVMGKVYYTPQINYILWGRINRLLSDDGIGYNITVSGGTGGKGTDIKNEITQDSVVATVKDYRKAKQYLDTYGVNGPAEWAKIGWNWTGKFTEVPADSLALEPNPRTYKGLLLFQVNRSGVLGKGRSEQLQAVIEVTGEIEIPKK